MTQKDTMSRSRHALTVGFVFLAAVVALPGLSEGQTTEEYSFVRGLTGTEVCFGKWIPPAGGLPGRCEGQLMDLGQFLATSTRASADRLEQMLSILAAMDQKLALSNDQLRLLTEATLKAQASMDLQVRQSSELLYETISRRFEQLPEEMLANELFREELEKLRKDILSEVEKQYARRPAPPQK